MTTDIERTEDQMIESIETQINDLAIRRRELTDQLAAAPDFSTRRTLADQIEKLGQQSLKLEAERRQINARLRSQPAIVPDRKASAPMPAKPTFKVYPRVGRNSVQAELRPAVSLTTTKMSFNDAAFEAMGIAVGDSLSILFAEEAGLIALKQPPKKWAASRSRKIQQANGAPAGCLQGMAAFLKWAGIDPKAARGIYVLEYDEDLDHWSFELPSGSWTKPAVARGKGPDGRPTAQRRKDLPATSPYRERQAT